MDHDDVSFGYWIRRRRKALDLTQEALAAQVNCSITTIRKIEADERRPSRQMAELLAQVLAIDPQERATFVKIARSELRAERLPATGSGLSPVPSVVEATQPAPTQATATLPLPATALVGRTVELTQLTQLLHTPTCRLLTLAGAGGIGKTRLALACAEQVRLTFDAGVFFVSLAPLVTPTFMLPAIASVLNFSFHGAADPKRQLLHYLGEKRLLLVLDNFEHLLAAPPIEEAGSIGSASLLSEMLQAAPRLKLLVTSRERLNLQDEWVFDLQGLTLPPIRIDAITDHQVAALEGYSSVTLFVQRARQAHSTFTLSKQNLADVVRICQLVEGMPLGIELAAAWVHFLSCREIADEIDRTIDFLAVTRRDVPARHRSLRATFDHSWQLLSEQERQVMRQLAVFHGGFTREAATQVAGATLPVLAALAAKSLIRRGATSRYDLHELVRQYAYDQLRAANEERATRTRHLAYFQGLAEQAYWPLFTAEQPSWVNRLQADDDNLRVALEWAAGDERTATDLLAGLRLAGSLWLFWWLGTQWSEGAAWLTRLLAVQVASHDPVYQLAYQQAQARATYGAATLALDRFEVTQAQQLAAESLRLSRAVDDRWGSAFSIYLLAVLSFVRGGNNEPVLELLQESIHLFRQLDNKRGLSLPTELLGHLARRRGDHQAALAHWQEALLLNRAAGDPTGIAQSSDLVAKEWLRQGEYGRAQTLLAESLAVYQQLGNHFGAAYVLLHLGRIAHAQNDYPQAKQRYAESLATFQGLGSKDAEVFIHQGRLALEEGNPAEAQRLLERGLTLAQEGNATEYVQQAQLLLAMILLAQAEYGAAQGLLTESLALAQALQDKDDIAQVYCGWAQLALAQGKPAQAARALGVAHGLWQALGLPPPPELRNHYEECLRAIRTQLAPVEFQTAWDEGKRMSAEPALHDAATND